MRWELVVLGTFGNGQGRTKNQQSPSNQKATIWHLFL